MERSRCPIKPWLKRMLDPTTIRGALILGIIAAVLGGLVVILVPWVFHHVRVGIYLV